MGPHQADSGLKEAMHENRLHEPELDRLDRLVRAELRTCIAGTDSGELGGPQKGLKRAKIARKVATKMGPHQADSGLKEAFYENVLHEPELDRLDRLVRASERTCMAGTDSGGRRQRQTG